VSSPLDYHACHEQSQAIDEGPGDIPTLTGRIVSISAQVASDDDYPVQQYDKVLFNPKQGIPVDFEGDNQLYVVPIEDVVAVFRKE
jgi:chaperonin GroES